MSQSGDLQPLSENNTYSPIGSFSMSEPQQESPGLMTGKSKNNGNDMREPISTYNSIGI